MNKSAPPTADEAGIHVSGRPEGVRLRIGDAFPRPRDLLVIAPHAGAHNPALRTGISTLVPLVVLVSIGQLQWAGVALLAALIAAFGRKATPWERMRLHAVVAVVQVGLIVAGTGLASLAPSPVVIVAATALVAGCGTFLADSMGWSPPGSVFFVFAFGVCAALPAESAQIGASALIASGSALVALIVTTVSSLFEGCRQRIGRSAIDIVHAMETHPRRWRILITHAVVCLLASGLAGLAAVGLGLSHPYWAMVAAIVPVGGTTTSGQLLRAGHRISGTGLGLLSAAALFAWPLNQLVLIGILLILIVATDLLFGRNYSLALVFLTPLTIGMPYLLGSPPLLDLLITRAVETAIGVGIVVVLIISTHSVRHPTSKS